MGKFGDDNQDEQNTLLQQQIDEDRQQVQEAREALRERQVAIIKSQGMADWSPQPLPYRRKQPTPADIVRNVAENLRKNTPR